jgi:hypothetical protein
MPTFEPPTADVVPRTHVDSDSVGAALFGHYRPLPRGVTVLKMTDGSYVSVQTPTQTQIEAPAVDIIYFGGHVYEVDDVEASALQAAGFTVQGLGPPPPPPLVIDDLVGTIDDLVGTINNL